MFIVLDGPNGVGKTSVGATLAETLQTQGRDIVRLRQPSDSEVGAFARACEEDYKGLPLAALVVADRYLQIEREIKPALAAGRTVVLDRYVPSTLVLQRLDNLDLQLLWEMNQVALVPDLTVLLVGSVDVVMSRLVGRGRTSRFEQMDENVALEVQYFRESADFLRQKGYRLMLVETDELSIRDVADEIVAEIARIPQTSLES